MEENEIIYAINHINKVNWPEGPWKLEPDKVLWINKKSGYECLIKRIRQISHLCGYVGITKSHPLYGTSLLQFRSDKKLLDYFNVHGKITMSYPGKRFDSEPGPENKIGRAEIEGRDHPSEIWWIGMDFVQNSDIIPLLFDDPTDNNGQRIYRDIGFVSKEINRLAELLFNFKNDFEDKKIVFEKLEQPIPQWAL